MEILAKITGVKYKPFLCKQLSNYNFGELSVALEERRETTFILCFDENNLMALSWWVSPKRTRSYPYTRVYDSLGFSGKKVTIIPVIKDEGADGDRDFLQWDTVAMMSLIGVYVILAYYSDASQNPRYENKITTQRFDVNYIKNELMNLSSYQSDALHWNVAQVDKLGELAETALQCYDTISSNLDVRMHSKESAQRKIKKIKEGKEIFIAVSRDLAESAQKREMVTIQPKEKLDGTKASITIENYLGGKYFLTSDEVVIKEDDVFLIDGKHTRNDSLPSLNDIKDALVKMILFTNLEDVTIEGTKYNAIPVVKLTTGRGFNLKTLSSAQIDRLEKLKKEAENNQFKVIINSDQFV